MNELVNYLIAGGVLKTPRLIAAFRAIDRAEFVLPELKHEAYLDVPLSIGYGQTISQPTTVAMLLEWLQPKEGNKILDVGSGSGWTTALLSSIVGATGRVIGVELISELAEFGRQNVAKYNFIKTGIAELRNESAEYGFPKDAPFDRILSGASATRVPSAWREQLAVGGRMVLPVKDSVWLFVKNPDGSFAEEEYPGFAFVPFVKGTDEPEKDGPFSSYPHVDNP